MNSLNESEHQQQDTANNLDPEIKPEPLGLDVVNESFHDDIEEGDIHDLD